MEDGCPYDEYIVKISTCPFSFASYSDVFLPLVSLPFLMAKWFSSTNSLRGQQCSRRDRNFDISSFELSSSAPSLGLGWLASPPSTKSHTAGRIRQDQRLPLSPRPELFPSTNSTNRNTITITTAIMITTTIESSPSLSSING